MAPDAAREWWQDRGARRLDQYPSTVVVTQRSNVGATTQKDKVHPLLAWHLPLFRPVIITRVGSEPTSPLRDSSRVAFGHRTETWNAGVMLFGTNSYWIVGSSPTMIPHEGRN